MRQSEFLLWNERLANSGNRGNGKVKISREGLSKVPAQPRQLSVGQTGGSEGNGHPIGGLVLGFACQSHHWQETKTDFGSQALFPKVHEEPVNLARPCPGNGVGLEETPGRILLNQLTEHSCQPCTGRDSKAPRIHRQWCRARTSPRPASLGPGHGGNTRRSALPPTSHRLRHQ